MLVLAGLFVAPSAAVAGCNHLVTSSSDPFARLVNLDDLIVGRSPLSLQAQSAPSPRDQPGFPRRTPCSGLSCSNSVPMPVSSITPVPDGRDRWGALGIVVDVDNTRAFRVLTDRPAPAPTGHKCAIFHPPRV
jgi:hypothetical protein